MKIKTLQTGNASCHAIKRLKRISQSTLVWKCEEKDWKGQREPWDRAWSVSTLQKFQSTANCPWGIKWEGPENETEPGMMGTASRNRIKAENTLVGM